VHEGAIAARTLPGWFAGFEPGHVGVASLDTHLLWAYVHIVLFVYWLGADVGLYLVMIFARNPSLSFETRATLIRLAFYIDLFPRVCFALILPVGMQLVRGTGLYPVSGRLLALAWTAGILWSVLHLALIRFKGTNIARRLRLINQVYELLMGGFFISVGFASLTTGAPIGVEWFAAKLLLFGLIFWVILGIDVVFQPFSMILRMGPGGSTVEKERAVTRATNITMAWAILLYVLVLAVAFLGKLKPLW
jgi:hypothetical protein